MKNGPAKLNSAANQPTQSRARTKAPAAPGIGQPSPRLGERTRVPTRLIGAQTQIRGLRASIVLTLLTLLALCLTFPPVAWGFLGFVALVPWLVVVCTVASAKRVYLLSLFLGFSFFAINIRWMIPVTIPGYIALTCYSSLFFPLAAWPIRHMHQRHGVSVALTSAIVWTAFELLRSSGPLAFPWFLLGHSQYKFLALIQISDVVGVYGISFLVAMVNGWMTDLLVQPILIWRSDQISRLPLGTASLAVLFFGSLLYGWNQLSSSPLEPGPKIAVVQHDFPMYVDERAWRTGTDLIFKSYLALGKEAAAQKPDLIVFPETAITGYLNDEFLQANSSQLDEIRRRRFPAGWTLDGVVSLQSESRRIRDAFQALADESETPIIMGSLALEWKPTAIPPRAESFNSTFLLLPHQPRPVARYDKNHLVLFGEYVPFRYTYPWLYQWLNSITPWGAQGIEYSLTSGGGFNEFVWRAASRGRSYRAGTPICYEEIMPYVGREFTRSRNVTADLQKNIDMLLTISNDGWFLHTAELEQHLAGAVFRAVENRIGIARSVNTGASAFIQPTGKISDRVQLASDKIAKLGPVVEALNRFRAAAEPLAATQPPHDYSHTSKALLDLRAALADLGDAFTFMQERLVRLLPRLSSLDPDAARRGAHSLLDQVREDLLTVRRWQRQPTTAPGFKSAELMCDNRLTLYTRWGDWFSQGAAALTGMMLLDWILRRFWRTMTTIHPAPEAHAP